MLFKSKNIKRSVLLKICETYNKNNNEIYNKVSYPELSNTLTELQYELEKIEPKAESKFMNIGKRLYWFLEFKKLIKDKKIPKEEKEFSYIINCYLDIYNIIKSDFNLEKEDIPEGLDYNECNLLNQEYVYSNIICYQEQQILLIMIKSLKEEINKTKNKKTEFNA